MIFLLPESTNECVNEVGPNQYFHFVELIFLLKVIYFRKCFPICYSIFKTQVLLDNSEWHVQNLTNIKKASIIYAWNIFV